MTKTILRGEVLTVVTDANGTATVRRFDPATGSDYELVAVPVSTTAVFGPYTQRRYLDLLTTSENVTASVAEANTLVAPADTAGPLAIQSTTVPCGVDQTIPSTAQAVVFGGLIIAGTIRCAGDLIIKA